MNLARHALAVRGRFDHQPPPLTWDYLSPWEGGPRDLAMVTCVNGHTTRLTAATHAVDHGGVVSPSYVCVSSSVSSPHPREHQPPARPCFQRP